MAGLKNKVIAAGLEGSAISLLALAFVAALREDSLEKELEPEDDGDDGLGPVYNIQVKKVVCPYRPDRRLNYRPLPGNMFMLVTFSIENIGQMPVVASFSDFKVESDKGRLYSPIILPDMDDDFGAARCPAPGKAETCTLLFEIPVIAVPVALWEEIGSRRRMIRLPGFDSDPVAS